MCNPWLWVFHVSLPCCVVLCSMATGIVTSIVRSEGNNSSYNRQQDFRLLFPVLRLPSFSVTLRGPPLKSETSWNWGLGLRLVSSTGKTKEIFFLAKKENLNFQILGKKKGFFVHFSDFFSQNLPGLESFSQIAHS